MPFKVGLFKKNSKIDIIDFDSNDIGKKLLFKTKTTSIWKLIQIEIYPNLIEIIM